MDLLIEVIKGFFKGVFTVLLAVILIPVGINAWVMGTSKLDMDSYEEAMAGGEAYECIVVLGASVLPDGTLSPILENRVKAAVDLYFQGRAPIIVMSGDGRAANYNEPNAMKNYAMALGVPADAVYCDPGGYHTYDTMWRVANVYGAKSALVVTQEYHLYRAVYDAKGAGMDAAGVVSDEGVYEDQDSYDKREFAARIQDFILVLFDSKPENTYEDISL